MQPAPRFDLIPMNRVDLSPGEKDWFLFQVKGRRRECAYLAKRRNRPACSVPVFRWAFANCSLEA
jgi:hypothetical protein